MATTDLNALDKRITELRDTDVQKFQNPMARDIATHCIGLLQDAANIERSYGSQTTGAGKEANYNTSR